MNLKQIIIVFRFLVSFVTPTYGIYEYKEMF